ncbi:hypothetical protein [Actinomyces glycerinitolerans]|uniref:hypothetical protein n=1 Tax=Actinomyces glycerinitolerans TaxID=1892869 RepID=UPI00111502B0|nr:hypothetical protein [Actinomyces glycerinitolerans]
MYDILLGANNQAVSDALDELDAAAMCNGRIDSSTTEWDSWIRNESFRDLIKWFADGFLLCVSMPASRSVPRGVLKIRWIETLSAWGMEQIDAEGVASGFRRLVYRIRRRLSFYGISPPVIGFEEFLDPDISTHFRFIVPPGMRPETVSPDEDMTVQYGGNTVSFYRRASPVDDYEVARPRLFLNVKRALFTFPALIGAIVSLFVVCTISYGYLTESASEGASDAVTIAALLPALIASYVALNDEHESVSVALGFRRLLLVLGVLGAVLFALVTSTWNTRRELSVDQCGIVMAAILLEWSLIVFFLFEVGRVETWRHERSRGNRGMWLTGLTVLAIGVLVGVACFFFSRDPWLYVPSKLYVPLNLRKVLHGLFIFVVVVLAACCIVAFRRWILCRLENRGDKPSDDSARRIGLLAGVGFLVAACSVIGLGTYWVYSKLNRSTIRESEESRALQRAVVETPENGLTSEESSV